MPTLPYVSYGKVRNIGLPLVDETIDKTGKLVKLMRGVYVDADDHIDAVVLRHAVRIARYLYSGTYLSAARAVLLGPTRDGHLDPSGRRNQRTGVRGLEIVWNRGLPERVTMQISGHKRRAVLGR